MKNIDDSIHKLDCIRCNSNVNLYDKYIMLKTDVNVAKAIKKEAKTCYVCEKLKKNIEEYAAIFDEKSKYLDLNLSHYVDKRKKCIDPCIQHLVSDHGYRYHLKFKIMYFFLGLVFSLLMHLLLHFKIFYWSLHLSLLLVLTTLLIGALLDQYQSFKGKSF